MDYHTMKRKELQALCKKHKIPANLTNLEMANRLASLLKIEQEKPRTAQGKSCLKSLDDLDAMDENSGDVKVAKKVGFSPEDQTFEFEKTNPRAVRLAARRRKSLLMVEETIQNEENVSTLEDSGNLQQKASEKADAVKRVKSTRTRGRGKKTEQADAAEAEVVQANKNNGRKKTPQKRVSSLVDSEVFLKDPGKRVKSTRTRGGGKTTEQAEAELLQAEENNGCKKLRVKSSIDSEILSLMDEGETKVLRRSSRNVGGPDELSPKRKTRSDCPPKKQDVEKAPKRCLRRNNRLEETHGDAVAGAKEERNETERTTHNTRNKKRARGLNETVSATKSDYVAKLPRQRRTTRAAPRRGFVGQADGNEVTDKSDAEIQEVGISSSGVKLRENENASQPGKSDEPSRCDGRRNSSAATHVEDIQTDAAEGTPLEKADTNVEDSQNLLYSSPNATEDNQGKTQPLCQTAPTPLLEECEFKNVNEGSCKAKNCLEELAEAVTSKGKTQLKNASRSVKALSARGKQQGNSLFISSNGGTPVDKQNIEDDYKVADVDNQAENYQAENPNWDTSEDAENLVSPSSRLKASPESIASKVPAEDNKTELVKPVLEAKSYVQCDPSLTRNSVDKFAGTPSFQGTTQPQHEATSPVLLLEASEPNNAEGVASVIKNIEQDGHELFGTITTSDQYQSISESRTVDTATGTAKEMQDGDALICGSEEGITVELYNLESQITKYFETAGSSSFPAPLEFQTRVSQPTDAPLTSPLMSNVHSPVDKCLDHLVARECGNVRPKEAGDGFTSSEMLNENSEGAGKFVSDRLDKSTMSDLSPKYVLDMKSDLSGGTVAFTEKAIEGFSPVEMLDEVSEGAEQFSNGSLDETTKSDGSSKQGPAMTSQVAGDTMQYVVEGLSPIEVLNQSSEDADKLAKQRLDEDIESNGIPKQELVMKSNIVESTEMAAEGFTPTESLNENSEGAEMFTSERADENIESDGSPKQDKTMKSDVAGNSMEPAEKAVEKFSPVEMLDAVSEGANKFVSGSLDEITESNESPTQGLAMKSQVAGDTIKSTVEGLRPTEMLNQSSEDPGNLINQRLDEEIESNGSPKQEQAMENNIVESTENAAEGFTSTESLNENSEGAEKFVSERADENIELDGSPKQDHAMKSNTVGDTVESTENGAEGFAPTELLNENSGGADNFVIERLDEDNGSNGSPKPGLAMKRDIAGGTVESTEVAVEGLTRSEMPNEISVGAEKYVNDKSDVTTESDRVPNQGLAMKSDLLLSVHEHTSFDDPGRGVELCLAEDGVTQRSEMVHGTRSSVVSSDLEGRFMTEVPHEDVVLGDKNMETLRDDGEGKKERGENGEWLYDVLLEKTDDLTSDDHVCSDIDGASTAKVHKVSPSSSRFSDKMELVAGSKERRELICADYLDYKSPCPQSAGISDAFGEEAGEIAHLTLESASSAMCNEFAEENMVNFEHVSEKGSMHIRGYRDESAFNTEDNMTAASEATEDQVPHDCFSSQPEPAHMEHSFEWEELENIARNEAAVDVVGSSEKKLILRSVVKANAGDENAKFLEGGPTAELHAQSPEALCPVQKLHSAEHTRLENFPGYGILGEVPDRTRGQEGSGHILGETAFSSDESELNDGKNFSVAMEAEETGEKQYKEAENYYVEGFTPAAKVEEAHEGVDVSREKIYDTAVSERSHKKELVDINNPQLIGNEDTDYDIQKRDLEMSLTEKNTQKPAVVPENSGSQDFELTSYETALFMGDKFGDEGDELDYGPSDRSWWISSTTDNSKKEGENGMEHVVGDHISKQGCDSSNFTLFDSPVCGADDSTQETVAVSADFIQPCQAENEALVHPEDCNAFEENTGRNERVMKDENHSMDQAEKGILENLMKEDELFLSSMDDDTLEGGGNKDIDIVDQVTASYSEMSSLMPDDMLITGDVKGTSETANPTAENRQSCDLGVKTQVHAASPESSHPAEEKIKERTLAEEDVDGNGIFKEDEAMSQQEIKPVNEETKDARRQEVNMSSGEPASLMNHKKRSILIHGTPKRPIISADMKENSTAHGRKELVADATAQRPLARRKALGELPRM